MSRLTTLCDPTRPSTNAPRAAYLTVEHCDERVAFGGPLLDWEVLTCPASSPTLRSIVPIPAVSPGSGARSLATRCKTKTAELSPLAPPWCLKARTTLAQCHRR